MIGRENQTIDLQTLTKVKFVFQQIIFYRDEFARINDFGE